MCITVFNKYRRIYWAGTRSGVAMAAEIDLSLFLLILTSGLNLSCPRFYWKIFALPYCYGGWMYKSKLMLISWIGWFRGNMTRHKHAVNQALADIFGRAPQDVSHLRNKRRVLPCWMKLPWAGMKERLLRLPFESPTVLVKDANYVTLHARTYVRQPGHVNPVPLQHGPQYTKYTLSLYLSRYLIWPWCLGRSIVHMEIVNLSDCPHVRSNPLSLCLSSRWGPLQPLKFKPQFLF